MDDSIASGTVTATITHSVSSADADYNAIAAPDVTVTVTDNDVPGILITETGGNTAVTEGGAEDSYSIQLATQPTDNVTVTLTYNSPDPQIYINGSSSGSIDLTFTPADWNIAQSVTIRAIDDSVDDSGPQPTEITHTVSSSDTSYNGLTAASVTVTVNDNDSAGVIIIETGGTTAVTEGGNTDSFSVYLTEAPSANVTVTFTFTSSRVHLNGNSSGTLILTFTSANYHIPQDVTAEAVNDTIQQGTSVQNVTWTSASTDTGFNSMSGAVNITVTDDDSPAVIVSETDGSTAATEGGSTDTLDVHLSVMPTDSVKVRIAFDPNQISLNGSTTSPLELNFTSANYAAIQTVTISAYDDTTVEGNHSSALTFTVISNDTDYNNYSVSPLTVQITDNDISPLAAGGVVYPTADVSVDSVTKNITLPSADMTKSFVICYFKAATSNPAQVPTCQLSADDTLTIKAEATGNLVWYYRVTFAAGINVQRGAASIAGGSNTTTATIPQAVDLSKAFIIAYARTAQTNHANDGSRLVTAVFTDSNTITFERSETSGALDIEWQVVELDGALVHSGTASIAAGNLTGTGITSPLVMNSTFMLYNLRALGTGGEERAYHVSAAITSTSEVTFERKNSTGSLEISWFAIEMQNGTKIIRGKSWDYASDTATSFSRDTSLSTDAYNPQSYVQARSVPFCSHSVSGTDASDLDSASLIPVLNADGVTLTMTRSSSQSVLGTIEWYIMELNSN